LDADIDTIITTLRNTFDQKYASLKNTNSTMTQHEIVTIASLIEREGKHDADRPIIASIIYNRLENDMPLQIDATVQYILGFQPSEQSWWKRHLSFDDLKINSAYNTYIQKTLPPTPIANPGVESLQAAVHPDQTDYLFYITDKNGINRYAKTNEEHEKNIEKYGL
ncbi:MAG: endolytic transglycosylase MltG, partial [Candidatus Levybacteria bacterium]|nr:endolytic transglycosylase MltG [Candidatus Levybacteria bacterium]